MKQSPEKLFQQYLEICNKALEVHKEDFPYKQIWDATEKVMDGKPVVVSIYDDRPKATYRLTLHDKHIQVEEQPEKDCKAWHINMSYLEKVVENPEEYIGNPAKIDWDWLCNRLGRN